MDSGWLGIRSCWYGYRSLVCEEVSMAYEGHTMLFRDGDWSIWRPSHRDASTYAHHHRCKGNSLGESAEHLHYSWFPDDDLYEGYADHRCYGCRDKVPDGVIALILLEEM